MLTPRIFRDSLRRAARHAPLYLACAAWIVAVAGALWMLYRYELTPGTAREVARQWPKDASFGLAETRPTLVMFVHPRCPCSRATIEELNRLLVRRGDQVEALVVFVRPPDVEAGWERSTLWREVAALPGVRTVCDEAGRDRTLFGASLSGETLLYDASGRLMFRGGITPSRGHVGDNAGVDALAARIKDPGLGFCATDVFGCRLCADE